MGELSTPIGHLICTAAVIDDVLSLLLLAEVEELGGDDTEVRRQSQSVENSCESLSFVLACRGGVGMKILMTSASQH